MAKGLMQLVADAHDAKLMKATCLQGALNEATDGAVDVTTGIESVEWAVHVFVLWLLKSGVELEYVFDIHHSVDAAIEDWVKEGPKAWTNLLRSTEDEEAR